MNSRHGRSTFGSAPSALVVEDDPDLSTRLVQALRGAGYRPQGVFTALEALRVVAHDEPDIVLLDLGLPDVDGADALRMMRGASNVPVVIATARRDELRVVQLLNAGADDYLVKPFSVPLLVARMGAVLRRVRGSGDPGPRVVSVGALRIDLGLRQVHVDGRPVALNRKEFDVLKYLAEHRDRVVPRAELVAAVWGRDHSGREQSVDVHVSWLRRKLGESAAAPRHLVTVRGVGFRLVDHA
ncbi:response regulator [Saccharothrix sp. NRRL B-16348]|uniref:response regulator transcription factor n=1 Tax=Saccharothrix sp. NRRL B-16348 TaxID=1415542 RepID=UPI0006AFE56F|nr:response regulator transcription factor [Saccharothrix sp. NRRL B-16348]KOX20499.1 response regulator [Saccharothrix sp. NRRL B-16348]